MMEIVAKSLRAPDEHIEFPRISIDTVEIGDVTVARVTAQPGWRWSRHMQPTVGGDWCQARHVGVILRGQLRITMSDGEEKTFGPDDVYHIAPGHDGHVLGDEPVNYIEWTGVRPWIGYRAGPKARFLRTLLFTDLVDSTRLVNEMGDAKWREHLSVHFEASRDAVNRFGGVEVKTTGDGILATFEGPMHALGCAADIIRASTRDGLAVRSGVHVGEVEVVGHDVRGSVVHEAARIMSAAGANEILVSEIAKVLASSPGATFDDRGTFELKGFPTPVRLYAYQAGT